MNDVIFKSKSLVQAISDDIRNLINLIRSVVWKDARVRAGVRLKAGSHGTRVFSRHVSEVSRHSCEATET